MVKAAKRVIAKLASEYKKEWDETLPQAELALISWQKSPFGMSPYKMKFGVDMPQASAFENPLFVHQSPTAEKMKEIDDVVKDARHVKRVFEEGDLVWWREHEPANKLEPKRSGPYEIKRVISDINYELAEVLQGPKIGTRHKIVHVQHIEKFEAEGGEEEEEVVEEIIKHRRIKEKVKYLTRFSSGEELWLEHKDLIDKLKVGYQVNAELKRYWARTPKLRPWVSEYLS